MDKVNWLDFLNLLPFMLIGVLLHILKNLNKAKMRTDYEPRIFWKNNWLGYLIALITCTTLLTMLTAGVELMPTVNRIMASFTLGVTGGSIFKGVGK